MRRILLAALLAACGGIDEPEIEQEIEVVLPGCYAFTFGQLSTLAPLDPSKGRYITIEANGVEMARTATREGLEARWDETFVLYLLGGERVVFHLYANEQPEMNRSWSSPIGPELLRAWIRGDSGQRIFAEMTVEAAACGANWGTK